MNRKNFKAVFKDTVPVMTGYIFLGFGFGILMHQNGYGFGWAFAMSFFIYAGSMQYMAVSLLSGGASLIAAALAALAVNARHLFYGISMVDRYKGAGKKKAYMIFALTDETYSLVASEKAPSGMSYHTYCFAVTIIDHIYWVTGTVLGSLAGTLIPVNLKGIDFALTALFVTIFTEQWLSTKAHTPAIIGIASTLLCLVLFGKDIFLIPSMVLIVLTLTVMRKTGRRDKNA